MRATIIKDVSDDYQGTATLYRVDPPMEYYDGRTDESRARAAFVVASAVVAPYTGPETYIFPTTEDGSPINYQELEGSYRGGLEPDEAIRNAGYRIET